MLQADEQGAVAATAPAPGLLCQLANASAGANASASAAAQAASLAAGGWRACGANVSYADLADGPYQFGARAGGGAGGAETWALSAFDVNCTPPVVRVRALLRPAWHGAGQLAQGSRPPAAFLGSLPEAAAPPAGVCRSIYALHGPQAQPPASMQHGRGTVTAHAAHASARVWRSMRSLPCGGRPPGGDLAPQCAQITQAPPSYVPGSSVTLLFSASEPSSLACALALQGAPRPPARAC